MKTKKFLDTKGVLLEQNQLINYFEKMASEHIIQEKSCKDTYPIPRLDENFKKITNTYEKLKEDIKNNITIHPAGEWLLDNYYIIEQCYKMIKKRMSFKLYKNFPGISNGKYKGFARVYLLASEIIAYTEGQIDSNKLEMLLTAYQNKKTLTMEEIWNISIFLYIAIIEQIKNVCEKIYFVQTQKYKVESLIERLVERKNSKDYIYLKNVNNNILLYSKEAFIEYLSYRLKQYGKKGTVYLKILEEQVNKTGTTISDIINKEHFDVAINKFLIGNCIKSIKEIQRINLIQIFEKTNDVEKLLKEDPADIYRNMTYKTKEYYRNHIKKISSKFKVSEIYVTSIALKLANQNKDNKDERKRHIGYYIVGDGEDSLKEKINNKEKCSYKRLNKGKLYIVLLFSVTSILNLVFDYIFFVNTTNIILTILFVIISYIPISEIVSKVLQYIFSKINNPYFIPKMDFTMGIPKECCTMIIVPTILKDKNKVKEMMEKLEVYYLANKSENIYFTLLGDCTTSTREKEEFDEEIILTGKTEIEKLNQKYGEIFNFIYRKRIWNNKENRYMGWERKRGLIKEFNDFLLDNKNNTFICNTLKEKIKVKYIITLDSDTNLVLDSAKELIGAMAHPLNKPIIDANKNIVIEGYGIMQPRIDIDINSSRKNLFTKIFAGMGGIDSYSGAISDIYQDNFGEGIFTGKGIYDLEIFKKIMENTIPEETVLSHDLLEGIYVRCGLVTDVVLLDSFPSKFNSYMLRNTRWIRGDWQLIRWLGNKIKDVKGNMIENPINEVGKFKILDNLRRSLLEATQVLMFFLIILSTKSKILCTLIFASIFIDFIIACLNIIIFKKYDVKKQALFENNLTEIKACLVKSIIKFSCIVYTAITSTKAIIKTLYRVFKTKENLLEWITSEEAESINNDSIGKYNKEMWTNILIGLLLLIYSIYKTKLIFTLIGVLWTISPSICFFISKKVNKRSNLEELNKEEIEILSEIAKRTWKYFEDNLIAENNYLITDNYQEERNPKIVNRTSSTNIGLELISIISAYDLKFINLDKCLYLIRNALDTIMKLKKWNGHLYNWYNIETLETLKPEYVSTVDSGNFVGYLFTLKDFIKSIKDNNFIEKYKTNEMLNNIENLINATDFSKLYNDEISLFNIGYNAEENKKTDSYYDLLASEARQASLIAIAKKDIPLKHWKSLGRTLTTLDGKKGLVSWSGTAFEYLMPNINIKNYKGSLFDESCKFMILSQKKYCNKLGVPWGISESAFNLKDLKSNYQYKAFGIPWLGLKRGLADEIVVSSYGSMLALPELPKDVIENIRKLQQYNIIGKYGMYEAIDFTPERLTNGKEYEIVKTYMAHHQALILLAINNLINNNLLQERFHNNPEIKAVDLLLQEKMPEDMIITKEKKEKIEKIKYNYQENNYTEIITNFKSKIPRLNVISNEKYMICMNQDGTGFSKYKDILINRYKNTNEYKEGIFVYYKNLQNNEIWGNYLINNKQDFKAIFTNDMNKTIAKNNNIKTINNIIVTPNDNVEIRNIEIENLEDKEALLEISTVLEPVLSTAMQDYAHKAFNNLFLKYKKIDNGILIERKNKNDEMKIFMAVGLFSKGEENENLEFEIDKGTLCGRLNTEIPKKIKDSIEFDNKIKNVVNPILAYRKKVKILKNQKKYLNFIISVAEDEFAAIENLNKYKNFENVDKAIEISKTRNCENARYLQVNSEEMLKYQKLLSLILNPNKKTNINKLNLKNFKQNDLWKYGISGDYPILLLKINQANDLHALDDVLKAFCYYKNKNIKINIVIINEEKNEQEKYVKEVIEKTIIEKSLEYLINNEIFILKLTEKDNLETLLFKANIIIDTKKDDIDNIIAEVEEYNKTIWLPDKGIYKKEENFIEFKIEEQDLIYKNGYGGFSKDGKEYTICVNQNVPSVWCNILANEKFGTILTQNLGGYSWYKNSRLFRLSKWSNDAIFDIPSEKIYIKDNENNVFWRIGEKNLLVTHGMGYSIIKQDTEYLKQKLDIFISMDKNIKINLLNLKNNTSLERNLEIIYEIDVVLDEDEIKSCGNIETKYNQERNYIYSKNLYPSGVDGISYIYSSEKITNYTGDFNSINLYNNWELNNRDSIGKQPCMAIKINVKLRPFEEKEVSLVMGSEEKIDNINMEYKNIEQCKKEKNKTINYWENLLNKVRVKTPNEKINIMLNGWTMYQTISSRLFAKSRILSIWWSIWI